VTVITISRQYGSGGDEIAARVCELLGYRKFDRQLIEQVAIEAGLSDQEVIDYSEENHKMRGFFDRLFGRSPTVAQMRHWHEGPNGVRVVDEIRLSPESVLALEKTAILNACQTGNLVIVGRGGQVILRDCPGTLHVRIEAPLEMRTQRLKGRVKQDKQDYSASITTRRVAQDLIAQKDAASADYVRQFYGEDWDDAMLYHVVINTGRVSVEQAARVIARMAPEFE
jgi:cytidylate kinase